jgi:hypothetical protein
VAKNRDKGAYQSAMTTFETRRGGCAGDLGGPVFEMYAHRLP